MSAAPLRHLVLRLACVDAHSRSWVLAKLQATERARVEELLQEVEQLALTRDPSIVEAAFASVQQRLAVRPTLQIVARLAALPHPVWAGPILSRLGTDEHAVALAQLQDADSTFSRLSVWLRHPAPPAWAAAINAYLDGSGEAS